MSDSRLPSWPYEEPLEESPRQITGAMPWLTALSNWLGLALPGRGGVGDPGDSILGLVQKLMQQERPVGKQRISGDLNWVARGSSGPPRVLSDASGNPMPLKNLSELGDEFHPWFRGPSPTVVHLQDLREILKQMVAKPKMGWRQKGGRFKF